MKNIFLPITVFLFILIFLDIFTLSAQEDEIQSDFVKAWLEAIPVPVDSEFDTL